MRINVSRRAQVGVPEQLLYEFQIPGLPIDDRGSGMPERMEAGRLGGASDPEAIQHWVEHVAPQHIGIEGQTIFFAEGEVL